MIVATFPFSEVFEADLLLLKLRLEAPLVAEWVIVENTYSFQGEQLGVFARKLIDGDGRFQPYRDRITVISADRPVRSFPPGVDADKAAFQVEKWQRDLATEHLLQLDPDVWILLCDVDEMLDCTDPRRVGELRQRLSAEIDTIQVPTQRYWFDFDNRYAPLYGLPLVRRSWLDGPERRLSEARSAGSGPLRADWGQIIGFEYTSCFPVAEIIRKLESQAHTGYTTEDLELALSCNHRLISTGRGSELRNDERDLLTRVVLTPENSPRFVRENLESLRTGNIPADYLANRRAQYPRMGPPKVQSKFERRILDGLEWLRKKAIYSVRMLGFKNFGLYIEDPGPSPWFD